MACKDGETVEKAVSQLATCESQVLEREVGTSLDSLLRIHLQGVHIGAISEQFGDDELSMREKVSLVALRVDHGHVIISASRAISNRQPHEIVRCVLGEDRRRSDLQPTLRGGLLLLEELSPTQRRRSARK